MHFKAKGKLKCPSVTKKTKTTKINIKGKTMHPNSTKYPKMVKQQHRDVKKKQKTIHFIIKTRFWKLSQRHKNQTRSKWIQTA